MEKLHFSFKINAPVKKVWDTMLGEKTFREWTSAFMPGGYFEGSWDKGSKIKFLAPNKDGKPEGMSSEIAENRPYEFVSIRHLGVVIGGKEDLQSQDAKEWGGKAYENYTFTEVGGSTEVSVDMDTAEQWKDDMTKTWPKALARLKEIAEKS